MIEKQPLISIIIPVFNHYGDLFETLKSIFQQSLLKQGLEVIVVDDGSTDKHIKQDQELLKIALPQVKFFKIEHQGASVARNFGFKMSHGQFVIFWDADLTADKLFLEKLFNALKNNPEASYAYSSFYFGWKKFSGFEFSAPKLKEVNFIPTTSLIRREDFLGFDESLGKFQDWDLWLSLLKKNKKGVWVPEYLFKAKSKKKGLSFWLPSFIYKIPWLPLPSLKKYQYWKKVIYKKHDI